VSGSNPLVHYLKKGVSQGRDPGPLFSTTGYYKAHPELKQTKVNPLAHFLSDISVKTKQQSTAIPASKPAERYSGVSSPGRPRAVIIDSVYPTPDKDSGSIDAVNFASAFKRLGYDVTFISDSQFYDSKATFESLEDLDVTVVNNRHSPSLEEFIQREGRDVSIFFLSRVHCGGRWLETAFRNSNAKIIFNTVDLHFLREERQAKLENDRKQLNLAAGTRERELCVTRLADATIVVSEAEGELLRELVPDAKIVVIPLGRESPGAKKTFEERSDIGFIGGFAHAPNVDAVTYFIEEIWPIIKGKYPSMKFYIYGSEMPRRFFDFRSLDVVPVGYVKEVGPILEQRRVMIAPLRYGAGAKGKVVTSLAHGVPCVASGIAAEGMGFTAGKNILIANSPERFADEVVSVYSNKESWSAISASGIEIIKERFAVQNTVDKLKALLDELHMKVN
jgi:glycosyltransferase involved in cell wall biosynthesis